MPHLRNRLSSSLYFCLFVLISGVSGGGCSGSSPESAAEPTSSGGKGGVATDTALTIGSDGGEVMLDDGARLEIPEGALESDVEMEVVRLSASEGERRTANIAGSTISAVYSFTPHGTRFAEMITIEIPATGFGNENVHVYRSDDETSNFEFFTQVAVSRDEIARFVTDRFSQYVLVRDDEGPGGGPGLDPDPDPDPPSPDYVEGDFVVEVYDSGSRQYGNSGLILDRGQIFWSRDLDGELTIFSADVTGSLPAAPQVLFQAPYAAQSGWSNPPLLATDSHVVFPTIGMIEVGGELVESQGWSVVGRDGTNFRLDLLDGWWLAARRDSVIIERFYDGFYSIALNTGADTLLDYQYEGGATGECIYDAERDEIGCYRYGLTTFDFSDAGVQLVSDSAAIDSSDFGPLRLAFNQASWFVPVNLPSGSGIGAYARDGGEVTYYEELETYGAFAVDEEHLYVCVDGKIIAVSLEDDSRTILAEDCGNAFNISLLGMDDAYLYYVHSSKEELDYPAVLERNVAIHRIATVPPSE